MLVLCVAHLAACSDVGDSSAVANDDGPGLATVDATTVDETSDDASPTNAGDGPASTAQMDALEGGGSTVETAAANADDVVVPESSSASASNTVDATLMGSDVPEASGVDSTTHDAGGGSTVEETGVADTSASDGGALDVETIEASVSDSSTVDSPHQESGADTGVEDAGGEDSSVVDASHEDAGSDDGSASPATPCTTAPCAASGANSLQCKGNTSGLCTATEALVLAYDIAQSQTAVNKKTSCYYCMVAFGCLDSSARGSISGVTTLGGSNLECEDTGAGNVASTNPGECRDALSCSLVSDHCTTSLAGNASNDPMAAVSNCYCGTALGTACQTAGMPNGACLTNEQTDLGSTDPTTILTNYVDPTLSPGGVGNAILNCALANACNPCFR
jgi:hypothetical protein